jgi:regulator of RNase E activity RraA
LALEAQIGSCAKLARLPRRELQTLALTISDFPQTELDDEIIAAWREIPAATASDELNRSGAMIAEIKPLNPSWTMVGPATTVRTMAADNLALHHAVAHAPKGAVVVIDAGGYLRNAVWGSILHRAAEIVGISGVVVDGCVRDVSEVRSSTLPCFARGVVPAGPHKGWGGEINGPIQAGGCTVFPGDLVIGDADGVVVVPSAMAGKLLAKCRERIEAERQILRRLEHGEKTIDIMGLNKA